MRPKEEVGFGPKRGKVQKVFNHGGGGVLGGVFDPQPTRRWGKGGEVKFGPQIGNPKKKKTPQKKPPPLALKKETWGERSGEKR